MLTINEEVKVVGECLFKGELAIITKLVSESRFAKLYTPPEDWVCIQLVKDRQDSKDSKPPTYIIQIKDLEDTGWAILPTAGLDAISKANGER